MPPKHRLFLPRSVRARTTAVAMLVVAGALGLGAAALVSVLRNRLTDSVDQTAVNRISDVVALEKVPDSLSFPGDDLTFIQVIDADGRVLSSTENAENPPVVPPFPATPVVRLFTLARLPNSTSAEHYRVATQQATLAGQPVTVIAGESLAETDATIEAVIRDLLIALPFMTGLVGLIAWLTTKRALQPVHRITEEVSSISESDLTRRVPTPTVDDEIGELATTMNAMLERVEHAMIRQRRFTADASHELRSPLTSLRTQIEVASSDPDGVQVSEVEPDLLAELDRLDHLVRDLLGMARVDARATVLKPFDVRDAVRSAMTRATSATLVHDLRLPDTAVFVVGAREHVTRAVSNLIDNAERHASNRIAVSLDIAGEEAVIEVRDDGAGIPADKCDYVFQRFTRLDDARTRDEGGSGLGLAIVRDIVEMHGGTVKAFVSNDSAMTGADMVIRLPIVAVDDVPASKPAAALMA